MTEIEVISNAILNEKRQLKKIVLSMIFLKRKLYQAKVRAGVSVSNKIIHWTSP